jgi:excisionase family DNA binding protein
MLTVRQAAEKLGVSQALVYALVAARKIRHQRHGLRRGAIRIPEDALAEYQARCTVDVDEPPEEADQEEAMPVPDVDRKGPGIDLW